VSAPGIPAGLDAGPASVKYPSSYLSTSSRQRSGRRRFVPRDPVRTQERIRKAALAEFSAKGLAGARVDAIARRAGINKRMLYHYFGSKNGLFSAVLRHKVAQREALLALAPDDPSETLAFWFDAGCRDVDWFRLLSWEALQLAGRNPVHEAYRRSVSRQAVDQVRRRQAKGFLPAGLDPGHLLLTMMAITAYPLALPQVTRLVLGQSARDPAFQRERKAFLKQFAALLFRPRRHRGARI
jgi:TetR/AcrR family transcriptional regulator